MINPLYLLITILLTSQCSSLSTTDKDEDSDLQLVYTVDKEGLFLYDLKTGKANRVYSTQERFVEEELKFINDSIFIVAHQSNLREEEKERLVNSKYMQRADGDSTFITDNPPYKTCDKHVYVTKTFFEININTQSNFKSKTIGYEHIDHSILKIKTSTFDHTGQITSEHDTTIAYGGTSFSSSQIRFCDFQERYFSKSENVNGKQVFSSRGDLYMIEKSDTTMLLKFDGHFDPKFGSGYYNPTLSPDGKKVTYQYLAGFLKKGSALFEINIETKAEKKILDEKYFRPFYSPDGKKIAVARNQRETKSDAWINTIYVYDSKSGKSTKVGNGSEYFWRPMK